MSLAYRVYYCTRVLLLGFRNFSYFLGPPPLVYFPYSPPDDVRLEVRLRNGPTPEHRPEQCRAPATRAGAPARAKAQSTGAQDKEEEEDSGAGSERAAAAIDTAPGQSARAL